MCAANGKSKPGLWKCFSNDKHHCLFETQPNKNNFLLWDIAHSSYTCQVGFSLRNRWVNLATSSILPGLRHVQAQKAAPSKDSGVLKPGLYLPHLLLWEEPVLQSSCKCPLSASKWTPFSFQSIPWEQSETLASMTCTAMGGGGTEGRVLAAYTLLKIRDGNVSSRKLSLGGNSSACLSCSIMNSQ